ncbi:MAG: hypothetical protein LUD83_01890 [Clostridiales bacterium]|nr:hypothetical protein [Clostridiales bacterium]
MSEQAIKEVRAKFTADLSDFRQKVQEAGKISQDLQDRISAVGDAVTEAQSITGAEMQKIGRSLASAGKQAAALGKQAQSLAADESQLTRAIAEQEGSLGRMEEEYDSLQAESERLSGIFDTVKSTISGLNLSGTLSEELQKAQESIASYDNEIAQLRTKITEAGSLGYNAIQLDDGSIASLKEARQQLQTLTTAADQANARFEQLSAAAEKVGQANMGYASNAGLKQLQTELGNTNDKMEQLTLQAGQTASRLLTYQERLDQTKTKQQQTATATQELTNRIQEMEGVTGPTTLSQRLDHLLDSFQDGAWQTSLTQFQATMSDLFSWAGQMAGNTSFSDFAQGIGSAAQDAVAQFRQMTASVQESRSAFAATRQTASALASALKSVASSAKSATVWSTVATAAGKVKTAFGQLASLAAGTLAIGLGKAASGLLKVGSAVGRLASSGLSAAISGLSRLASTLTGLAGRAGSAVLSGLKSIASRITSIGSSAKSTANGGLPNMVRQIRNISVVSLGLKVCSSLFGQLRSVVNNCVSSNESLSNQVEVLQNSLSNALAPAISVVVNLLSKVMPYIVGIADAIASILTNLFGTGWTTVSTGLGSTASDAADSIDDVTDATNDAADAQEAYNRTIAGFDEITKLDDNSSSSSGSGSTGSGTSTPTTSTTDSTEGILGILPEWLQNIADLIENSEWAELGTYLADCLGDAVDKIYDVLTSEETYAKIDSAVNALTTTVNSFFKEMNLVDEETGDSIASKTGKTIGAAINLAFYTVNSVVTGIDWAQIGLTIANVINGAVEETNWSQIGETIANVFLVLPKTLGSAILNIDWGEVGTSVNEALTSAFNTVSGWLDSVDWNQVGQDIKTGISDALENLDASEIATSFSTMLGKAFGAIGTIINEVIIAPFTDWLTNWENWGAENGPYDELGMNILYGILNGIVSAITGIGAWIYDNILTPFIDGFKSTFGINSPATNAELLSAAGYVGEGILNGIASVFTNIGTWVQNNILTPISNAISNAGETVVSVGVSLANTASDVWNTFKTAWGKLSGVAVSIANSLADKAKTLWNNFSSDWGTRAVTIANSLKSTASTLWNTFSSNWGTRAVSIVNSLKSTASTLWNTWSAKWGTRKVSITNSLKNTAADLWKIFSNGWKNKTLGIKLTYVTTGISALQKAAYKALGLSGWPKLTFAARGGIVDRATLFGNTVAGEDGQEAIIPLERNTEWADIVATQIAGKLAGGSSSGTGQPVTITVYVGGEKLVSQVVDGVNAITTKTGACPIYV